MAKFTIDNLYLIYNEYKKKYKRNAYKYVSQVLTDAKPLHKKSFIGNDHEQSWRAFKGKSEDKTREDMVEWNTM